MKAFIQNFVQNGPVVSEKIWFEFLYVPCRKIGQGHSRVIIYINYDGQESPMLHTKFRENRPAGSGEEDFLRF